LYVRSRGPKLFRTLSSESEFCSTGKTSIGTLKIKKGSKTKMDNHVEVCTKAVDSNSNQKGESNMEPMLTDEQWEAGYPQSLPSDVTTGEMANDQEQQEIPQYAVRSDGLVLAPDLPEAEWQDIGRRFFKDLEWKQWAVGDWYAYGAEKYGKRRAYDLAQEATGWSKQTLYAYVAVARHFPLESCRRVQDLPFTHHRVVSLAGLEPEQEDYYLKTSKEREERADDLDQRIRNDKEGKSKPSAAEQPTEVSTQPSEAEQHVPKPLRATIIYSVREREAIANLRSYLEQKGRVNAGRQKIGVLSRALVFVALDQLGFVINAADSEVLETVEAIRTLMEPPSIQTEAAQFVDNVTESEKMICEEEFSGTTTVSQDAA
jgi:hypothetical protein